jgi:hypothetical protein
MTKAKLARAVGRCRASVQGRTSGRKRVADRAIGSRPHIQRDGEPSRHLVGVGWVTQDVPMGASNYTLIRPSGGGDENSQGGIAPIDPRMAAAGMTTRWGPYFEVARPQPSLP